jgi:hypothetical protein
MWQLLKQLEDIKDMADLKSASPIVSEAQQKGVRDVESDHRSRRIDMNQI